jgi:hypothetical protein
MRIFKKDQTIRANFATEQHNYLSTKQYDRAGERVTAYRFYDVKTEELILSCDVFRSKSGSKVTADLYVKVKKAKPTFEYGSVQGYGTASGCGYDKESKAIEGAIESAGIELFGTAYITNKVDFKKACYIGGVGSIAVEKAFKAICLAAGYNNILFVTM